LCEKLFKKRTVRGDTERYIVRRPQRDSQGRLGKLYEQAKRRFHQLERRFQEHPDLHQAHSGFTQEERYYHPHHAVFKSSSNATRTRIVLTAHVQVTDCL